MIGFSGSAIGSGDSGLVVTVASSAFTVTVVSGAIGLVVGAIYSGISRDQSKVHLMGLQMVL